MKFRFFASLFVLALFACNCHNYNSKDNYQVFPLEEPVLRKSQEPLLNPEMNTEQYDLIVENEFRPAFNYPLSTFGIDVDNASYCNTRRFLMQGLMPHRDAVRIEEFINYFDYDYPQPKGEHPFSITTELSSCPWNSGHHLIHVGLQGKCKL